MSTKSKSTQDKTKPRKQNTGNANVLIQLAGEYFVCSSLCRRQILALPAPKNNPLFDIVATSQDVKRTVVIQVKTTANRQGWLLGRLSRPEPVPPNLYAVLVRLKDEGAIECFVFEYGALLSRIDRNSSEYYARKKRDGTARKKLDFETLEFKSLTSEDMSHLNNWSTLGFD